MTGKGKATKGWFLRTAYMVAMMLAITSVRAQEVFRMEGHPATVQLRTNGVYDLLASPNIGIEIQTDLGLAWQLDYTGAWWNNDDKHRYFSNYAFETELRYYLASQVMDFPYTGHHVGIYGQLATFDFEFGGKGKLSRDLDMTMGIGASYGYTKAVGKRLSIDFTLGIGFLHSRYDNYRPNREEEGYSRLETRELNFVGPTKLEVTLVWNINAKNEFQNR